MLQSAVTSRDIRAIFHASLANVEAVHCTLYREPFARPCEDATAADDQLIVAYHQAFLKEASFLWGAKTYILKKTVPTYRGQVDAATGMTIAAPSVLAPIANQADNTLADIALMQQPTKFTIQWGAARYPQNGMVGGEDQHYQAESLGLSSYREGAGNQESSETTRKVYSISLQSLSLIHISEPTRPY